MALIERDEPIAIRDVDQPAAAHTHEWEETARYIRCVRLRCVICGKEITVPG